MFLWHCWGGFWAELGQEGTVTPGSGIQAAEQQIIGVHVRRVMQEVGLKLVGTTNAVNAQQVDINPTPRLEGTRCATIIVLQDGILAPVLRLVNFVPLESTNLALVKVLVITAPLASTNLALAKVLVHHVQLESINLTLLEVLVIAVQQERRRLQGQQPLRSVVTVDRGHIILPPDRLVRPAQLGNNNQTMEEPTVLVAARGITLQGVANPTVVSALQDSTCPIRAMGIRTVGHAQLGRSRHQINPIASTVDWANIQIMGKIVLIAHSRITVTR